MNRTRTPLLCLVFLGFATHSVAQSFIDPSRRIDWTQAGIPGGIPVRTTVCATLTAATYGNGSTNATSAIQNAIDGCPAGQVVYLPAGTYVTTQTIHLRSNRTLRGAGPGQTTIRYQGATGRSVLDIKGNTYNDIWSLRRTFAVTGGATKDSRQITLSSTAGISAGDVLLIDQRNDGVLVDNVGKEGPCTYCSREDGTRARGQFAEVTAVSGNTVSLNLSLFWTFNPSLSPQATLVSASSMVRRAGVEDLSLTQSQALNEYLIEMDGAQYCWLKNIDVSRIMRRSVWHILSLQNEIRDSRFHDAIAGFGVDRGYGIQLDLQSTATLIENNVFHAIDGGGLMAAGGATGNVFAYNYMTDMRYNDSTFQIAAPILNHSAHPSMNLWEGNIGIEIGSDFIHGSSSHNTMFRCRSAGWQNTTATRSNEAFILEYKNLYLNVVGCVLGTPGQSNTYEVAYPAPLDYSRKTIWLLGYEGPNGVGHTLVKDTLVRHGNWDSVTNGVVWDPAISERTLPASLYRPTKPSWFGNLAWPAFGPDVSSLTNGTIPAKVCHSQGAMPNCLQGTGSSPPTPPTNVRIVR
jgi:hypothetical protein